jgi:hypothetical protein
LEILFAQEQIPFPDILSEGGVDQIALSCLARTKQKKRPMGGELANSRYHVAELHGYSATK